MHQRIFGCTPRIETPAFRVNGLLGYPPAKPFVKKSQFRHCGWLTPTKVLLPW